MAKVDDIPEFTEEWWAERLKVATRKMRRELAKIDHDRRGALIKKQVRGKNMTTEEKVELERLQAACDAAMEPCDKLILEYNGWKYGQG